MINPKSKLDGGRFQFLGRPEAQSKTRGGRPTMRPRLLPRRPRTHDPMLVLNMSIFNAADGWDRIFNPHKAHENGAS